jgi:hypothetical protein
MSECSDCGEVHRQAVAIRFTCAAWWTRGCLGFLQFEAPPGMVLPDFGPGDPQYHRKLDAYIEQDMDERVEWYLLEKGWRRVGGRWVCPHHPVEDMKWT